MLRHRERAREPLVLLLLSLVALVISGISPFERLTWVLEAVPIFIFFPVFVLTFKSGHAA